MISAAAEPPEYSSLWHVQGAAAGLTRETLSYLVRSEGEMHGIKIRNLRATHFASLPKTSVVLTHTHLCTYTVKAA